MPGNAALYALVDMGSNGIRFSISSLAHPAARALPTVYQSRLGISLYSEQYRDGKKIPIPQKTIATIVSELRRFKQIALDFGVPEDVQNVRILATEATRNAANAKDFINSIETALGPPWKVDILAKEDEGRIGALGVVSSVGGTTGLQGLMMDLGGGSTQITWLIAKPGEDLRTSDKGSISFPYGAAAMTRLLEDADSSKSPTTARAELRSTIISQYRDAYNSLALPDELLQRATRYGLTLYLSGGGFRGWGYLLMSAHRIRPYPIPIINGFTVPVKEFKDTGLVSELALQSLSDQGLTGMGVFRVSKRRAAQVPAVAFLVDALTEAIPAITNVRFCQGGVREGWLWDKLPRSVQAEDPLVAATNSYAHNDASATHFARLLESALPADSPALDRSIPSSLRQPTLLRVFSNLLFLQQGQSKESVSVNAAMVPITGILAPVHGTGHEERALLALMLAQRWGGTSDMPAPYNDTIARVELLLKSQEVWWARYLGLIGKIIGEVYPAGRLVDDQQRLSISAKWSEGLGKKGNMQGVVLSLDFKQGISITTTVTKDLVASLIEDVEEMGKKKNRVGGKEYGFGVPLRAEAVS